MPVRADDPFLAEVLAALKKRSKALKHKNFVPAFERILEIEGEKATERLDLRLSKRPHQQFSCTLLADRMTWIAASERLPKGGWKFEFSEGGRLLPTVDGRGLVALIEETLSTMFEMEQAEIERIEAIWRPNLAKGPQPIGPC